MFRRLNKTVAYCLECALKLCFETASLCSPFSDEIRNCLTDQKLARLRRRTRQTEVTISSSRPTSYVRRLSKLIIVSYTIQFNQTLASVSTVDAISIWRQTGSDHRRRICQVAVALRYVTADRRFAIARPSTLWSTLSLIAHQSTPWRRRRRSWRVMMFSSSVATTRRAPRNSSPTVGPLLGVESEHARTGGRCRHRGWAAGVGQRQLDVPSIHAVKATYRIPRSLRNAKHDFDIELRDATAHCNSLEHSAHSVHISVWLYTNFRIHLNVHSKLLLAKFLWRHHTE